MTCRRLSSKIIEEFKKNSGIEQIIKRVQTYKLSIHAVDPHYSFGLLHFAVNCIDDRVMFNKFLEFYLVNGGNINARSKEGHTPLDLCPSGDVRGNCHWKAEALGAKEAKHGSMIVRACSASWVPEGCEYQDEIISQRRKKRTKLEAKWFSEAKQKLPSKEGLVSFVNEEVLHNILVIRTQNGICGMGFFQFGKWIISNAHIFPRQELLVNATFEDLNGNQVNIDILKSFHRPCHNYAAPDLAVINVENNQLGSYGLQIKYTENEGTDEIYFYIDCKQPYGSRASIKELIKLPSIGKCPDVFVCKNGHGPQPGDSGSPIFAARVLNTFDRSWQVKVVGALYACCDPAWYNRQASRPLEKSYNHLVCAIPVLPDLEFILQAYLLNEDNANRAAQCAEATTYINQTTPGRDYQRYKQDEQRARALMRQGFYEYQEGKTVLDIELPDGLEKLWYKTIVRLEQSLLIRKVLKNKVLNSRANSVKYVPDVSAEELHEDCQAFFTGLQQEENIHLTVNDGFRLSPSKYLRLDVAGGNNSHWTVQLQDCTGKIKMKPNGKGSDKPQPLSSVFASVQIPSELEAIPGEALGQLLLDSYKQQQNVAYENSKSHSSKGKAKGECETDPDKVFADLLLDTYDTVVCEIAKDGHCQFSAILYQAMRRSRKFTELQVNEFFSKLKKKDVEPQVNYGFFNLKKKIVKYMKSLEGEKELKSYFNRAECSGCSDYQSYVAKLEAANNLNISTKIYGNEMTLHAMAKVLNRVITVLSPAEYQDGRPTAVGVRFYGVNHPDAFKVTNSPILVYDGSNHYDSISYLDNELNEYIEQQFQLQENNQNDLASYPAP